MAQIDANATQEQLAQMEREFARKRAAAERRRAAERARLSEERSARDGDTTWSYVVVDGAFARITSCATHQEMLLVPDEVDGVPVRELDAEALSYLDTPREIICADAIQAIGPYAFRACENLHRLVLPAATDTFAASWTALCPNLKDLVLPGSLEAITRDVLANTAVEHLTVGPGTRLVKPGAFEKSHLRSIEVDPGNEHLKTDGICIYTIDGTELVALAVKTTEYEVATGCRRLGTKAFVGAKQLAKVSLPDSLKRIDSFAFAHSGLTELTCPPQLIELGAKACLRCSSLREAHLNEGLRTIGEEAFANSGLQRLSIPASVEKIGPRFTTRTQVRHAGPDATLFISQDNETYLFDDAGCLYARRPDGVHLVELLERSTTSYRVDDVTVAIDEKAFAYHDSIESVTLPEGLRTIGDGAFRVCRKLRSISIPRTLESIGAEVFIDTALERFTIPAALVDIGNCALVTDGAHHEGTPPALRAIDVDPNNPRFFMCTGMLCRRTDTGANVVMFTNSCARVVFPEDIEAVEDYAFNNAFGIDELHLNARLRSIGACGLSVWCHIRHVRIDVAKPIEGRTSFVLRFPATSRSVHGFLLALGGLGHLYLPDIMAQYDNCIAAARDYRAPGSSDNASAYEQVQLIIGRLRDSVLLTDANRKRYRTLVTDNIEEICIDIARHDDRSTLQDLADLGLLNEENLERVTVAVGRLQDASMTGYLLEMKRLRFGRSTFDFDL